MLFTVASAVPVAPTGPSRRRTARGPKPPWQSRLWLSLLCLFVGSLVSALLPQLPPEFLDLATRAIVDEVVRYVAPLPLAAALGLNWFDRKQSATAHLTAGELARLQELGDRAAKAERKRGERGVATVELLAEVFVVCLWMLVFAAALGLPGCARQYKHCEFELLDHPTKPAPAARYEQRCDGGREYFDVDDLSTADKRRCP